MTALRKGAPLALPVLWLGIVSVGLALACFATSEPPVWDALSYVQKAYLFWQAVGAGQWINPFDLNMTVRPPGTIFMAYPFGWSDDYHWFYFRSLAIPLALLIAAVYIAAWSKALSPRGRWLLAVFALALAGMPMLYQFQASDLPLASNWGLVDGFLAGVCAVAAAAAMRSARARSVAWAVFAAALGAFSFWVKPAGLLSMALVGLAWLALVGDRAEWRLAALWQDRPQRRFVLTSLAAAVVIFGTGTGIAVTSEYFSPANVAFGRRVLEILGTEFASQVNGAFLAGIVRTSFGYVVPIAVVLGVVAALRERCAAGAAFAALACILAGGWFWIYTEISQVRYFLPFGVMAYVLVIPALLARAEALRPGTVRAAAAIALLPTLFITVFLFTSAPASAQRALGINLRVDDYAAETAQARAMLRALKDEGAGNAFAYVNGLTPPLRSIQAVWDYNGFAAPHDPRIGVFIPTDWQRTSTLYTEDLLRAGILAFEPVKDEATRRAILSDRKVDSAERLTRLINAWASELTEADGAAPVSETRVRLLRIVDPARFEAAIARLGQSYDLPAAYREANPQRWWSKDELDARAVGAQPGAVFRLGDDPAATYTVHAVEIAPYLEGLRAAFWVEAGPAAARGDRWDVFAHLVDAQGNIVANNQVELRLMQSPTPAQNIRYYAVTYPLRPPAATALAFGIFDPTNTAGKFLTADTGPRDWDGRRVIVPLPAAGPSR